MKKICIIDNEILVKTFDIKNFNKEYTSWFSGNNELLLHSRHYKKNINRHNLIKYFFNFLIKKNFFFGIFFKKSNELIGTITINMNNKSKIGDLGIFIGNKKYLSKGYALRSCQLIINYLIQRGIVSHITIGTKNENFSMLKLIKKLKMLKIHSKNSDFKRFIFLKYKLF